MNDPARADALYDGSIASSTADARSTGQDAPEESRYGE
jgi:hypothetical protein